MGKNRLKSLALMGAVLLSGCADKPQSITVDMFSISPQGVGATVGKIYIHPIDGGGIRLQPALHDLPPGALTLQINELPSCAPEVNDDQPAPVADNMDQLIEKDSSKSELPLLTVDRYGVADAPVDATQLTLDDLRGHSLVVHTSSDADGSPLAESIRIACGTVQLP